MGIGPPSETLSKTSAYIVNGRGKDPRRSSHQTALDRIADIVVGGLQGRPLMNDRDPDRAEAVREIATVLATAYLRLRFPEPPPPMVDCRETKSESCDGGLTI